MLPSCITVRVQIIRGQSFAVIAVLEPSREYAAAPILFSFCDFVVWLHVTVRYIIYIYIYIYIIREATVVVTLGEQ